MPNLFWYIGVSIISIASAACAIYMKRRIYKVSTLLVFYLFAAGLIWIGEFAVLGLFNSYAYKTGVFTNIWAQNLLGHLILNTTIYPAAAIIMSAYSLRYGWSIFIAAVFVLLEYLFVHIGIYEQHWWRYYMTAIIVIAFLSISRKVFSKIKEGCYGLTRVITFFFVALIIIHTPAPLLLLSGKQYYQMGFVKNLFGDLYLSSIIIIFFNHLIEAFLLVVFTCLLKKWYWKVMPFIISVAVQSIFAKMNILVIQDSWSLVYTLLIYEIFIGAFILVEKYTLIPDSP